MNQENARKRDATPNDQEQGPWQADPRRAFKDWLATAPGTDGKGYREGTVNVYAAMWSTFVAHMETRRRKHATLAQQHDIADFLENSPACRREEARRRYQLLLDRAFDAMAETNPDKINPAAQHRRPQTRHDDDHPMPFLTAGERALVFAELAKPSDYSDEEGWMRARAKAMCALMLGAGFKPGQANVTSIASFTDGPSRFVMAPKAGATGEHRALVMPEAWPAIESWLAANAGDGQPGGSTSIPMFPGRDGTAQPIDYARAFIGVKALLASLGELAGGERASPQTLRNSYGASLLERGLDLGAVREYMGYSRLEFARRFAHNHGAWKLRLQTEGQG